MKAIRIAIDGFSSCGKSTLAKGLAQELNYIYVDTGAMYRAVTFYLLQHHPAIIEDIPFAVLQEIKIDYLPTPDGKGFGVYLNNRYTSAELRTREVNEYVSRVSQQPLVRKHLRALQQNISAKPGVVMDGRDIGTVIMPHAELKIFLQANDDVRARRRLREMNDAGIKITYEEVLASLAKRDHDDKNRIEDPLRRADDALILDNTYLTREETLEEAYLMAISAIARV